jgi:predicted amidohydrolase
VHVAAVQLDISWENKPANHRRIEEMIDAAALPEGAFVVLPEMGDTGFSFDLEAIADERSVAWGCDLARRRALWIQIGDARRGPDGRGRNRATIVDPEGRVQATYEKVHPFSFGRESQHFTGGNHLVVQQCGDAIMCPLICYDLRFPELWRLAVAGDGAAAPAEVFAIGASWPAARQAHWRALLIARAIENQAYVVAVNRVGRDPALAYAGGSIVVGPKGDVLAEAESDECVLQARLDLAFQRTWRREFPALRDVHRDLLGRIPHRTAPAE